MSLVTISEGHGYINQFFLAKQHMSHGMLHPKYSHTLFRQNTIRIIEMLPAVSYGVSCQFANFVKINTSL